MFRAGSFSKCGLFVCFLVLIASASRARASINLEWRPSAQTVVVGGTVNVGFYAVSDSGSDQLLSAVDAIFAWDPAFLQLLGVNNTGAEPLLFSGFAVNDFSNLNEIVPPQDGDGFYQAFAFLGTPVAATPAGTLLTTFQFQALSETPSTPISVLASGGSPVGNTVVFDGVTPNTPVTGTLGGATVAIIPEPASLMLVLLGGLAILRPRRSELRLSSE